MSYWVMQSLKNIIFTLTIHYTELLTMWDTQKIKTIETLVDYRLKVTFDDDVRVIYDMKDDIDTIDDFKELLTERSLFENAQLDSSCTCVFLSDRVDLL